MFLDKEKVENSFFESQNLDLDFLIIKVD